VSRAAEALGTLDGRAAVVKSEPRSVHAIEEVGAVLREPMVDAAQGRRCAMLRIVDTEETGQFFFEVEQGSSGCRMCVEVADGAQKEVVEFRSRGVRLQCEFHELDEVGAECESGIVFAQSFVQSVEVDIQEGVEVAAACPLEADLALEKEVQLPSKTAFRRTGALGNRTDETVLLGHPCHDEARFGESGFSHQNGTALFHLRAGLGERTFLDE